MGEQKLWWAELRQVRLLIPPLFLKQFRNLKLVKIYSWWAFEWIQEFVCRIIRRSLNLLVNQDQDQDFNVAKIQRAKWLPWAHFPQDIRIYSESSDFGHSGDMWNLVLDLMRPFQGAFIHKNIGSRFADTKGLCSGKTLNVNGYGQLDSQNVDNFIFY